VDEGQSEDQSTGVLEDASSVRRRLRCRIAVYIGCDGWSASTGVKVTTNFITQQSIYLLLKSRRDQVNTLELWKVRMYHVHTFSAM
jgi:hypothetical protein